MVVIESYPLAVAMCIVTMLCWGSWANTQKLASKEWRFQLFYWDYALGVLLLTVLFALTLGNSGTHERGFFDDLSQAGCTYIGWALLSGVVFNLANILLVAAIDVAGMAVAFPIGIGLALVLGVFWTYLSEETSKGDPVFLFVGVATVAVAIILDVLAYKSLPSSGQKTTAKGITLSVVCGVLMAWVFPIFIRSMPGSLSAIGEAANVGMLTPYTALVVFAVGLVLSCFVFNVFVMFKPFVGEPVPLGDYFRKGNIRLHAVGIAGGLIWGVGMSFAIMAGDRAGYAISYGLGQGATMVAALWGVFIWKEFKEGSKGTGVLLALMFVLFLAGLSLIVYSNS